MRAKPQTGDSLIANLAALAHYLLLRPRLSLVAYPKAQSELCLRVITFSKLFIVHSCPNSDSNAAKPLL